MCGELILKYQEWLDKSLLILNTVCEGIVPAGKPEEAIYWRTKELYEQTEVTKEQLSQYCADGLALLADIEEEMLRRKAGTVAGEKEVCFILRRRYARQIASSLQMLVNAVYFLDGHGTAWETKRIREHIETLFEIDSRDEVKKVHAGVRIADRAPRVYQAYKTGNIARFGGKHRSA